MYPSKTHCHLIHHDMLSSSAPMFYRSWSYIKNLYTLQVTLVRHVTSHHRCLIEIIVCHRSHVAKRCQFNVSLSKTNNTRIASTTVGNRVEWVGKSFLHGYVPGFKPCNDYGDTFNGKSASRWFPSLDRFYYQAKFIENNTNNWSGMLKLVNSEAGLNSCSIISATFSLLPFYRIKMQYQTIGVRAKQFPGTDACVTFQKIQDMVWRPIITDASAFICLIVLS